MRLPEALPSIVRGCDENGRYAGSTPEGLQLQGCNVFETIACGAALAACAAFTGSALVACVAAAAPGCVKCL